MLRRRRNLLLFPLLVGMGCGVEGGRRTELYFGLSAAAAGGEGVADGRVTDQAFQEFLDAEVTPRFPDGYTVLTAEGRWREGGSGRTLREDSRVLILIRPAGRETSERVEQIRASYKARFHQQSVLRVDAPARAQF